MSLVEIEKVCKNFDALEVLREVSLAIDEREIVAVIGRSGSGKSTLLRCINGLEPIQAGSIRVDGLQVNAPDTDFTVKLLDVYPDGSAYNLDETIQRVRYREGYDRQVFMEPGQVYEVEVSPMSTSNFFAEGHRLRIEVSSSNFPRFTRNLNTGGNNYDETEGRVAHNRVHHSAEFPSQIRVPVVRW